MRRWLSLLPLFCLLLTAGCWDFDALSKGIQGDAPPIDGARGPDLLVCQPDCSNCTDRAICQPIADLYGYGELVTDGNCPSGDSAQGLPFYDSMDPGNTCMGCACGTPSDCSYALQFYKDNNCKNSSGGITQVDKNCTAIKQDMNYQVGSSTLTCAPDASKAKVVPGWMHQGQLCLNSTSLSDCKNGPCILGQAAQVPGKTFCAAVKSPNATCPAGLTKMMTWYGYQDSRTCSCSCGTPTSTACKGMFNFYSDPACMMNQSMGMTSMCTASPPAPNSKYAQFVYMANGETCSATGSPQGQSPQVTTLTLCCNM